MALKFKIQRVLHNKLYIKSNKDRTELGIGGIDEASQAVKELIEEELELEMLSDTDDSLAQLHMDDQHGHD